MKVKFEIQRGQETFKDGMFSSKQVEMYKLTSTFTPSELEKKIFNDHPLFQDMLFMEYSEVDKFTTGLIFKETHGVDLQKKISIKSIYTSPTYTFKAYSIQRILELRGLVLEAGENFASNIKMLSELEGAVEIEFKPKD
jgi:hypothetical protein